MEKAASLLLSFLEVPRPAPKYGIYKKRYLNLVIIFQH